MTDRNWVNAVITIVVPLDDITIDSDPFAKQEAAGRELDVFNDALADGEHYVEFVSSCRWEDVHDEIPGQD